MDQIGARSGTGRGQFYFYFADKADLVSAVVTQQVERVLDAQQPHLGAISTADDLREWCRLAVQQYAHEEAVRCPLGSLVHELTEHDEAARATLADGFGRWRAALADGLRRAKDRGELSPMSDPEAVAAALLAAYQGGVLLAEATQDRDVLRLALEIVATAALTHTAA